MRAIGWTGLALIAVGILLREIYYGRAVAVWMGDAYQQGIAAQGNGAPMNYFHQDWRIPQELSTFGWLALAVSGLGLFMVGFAQVKARK